MNRIGSPAQLALVEEYQELFEGQTVVYLDGDGKQREGKVLGYELYGGGNSPWLMSLRIKRRGGWESVRVAKVLDYA